MTGALGSRPPLGPGPFSPEPELGRPTVLKAIDSRGWEVWTRREVWQAGETCRVTTAVQDPNIKAPFVLSTIFPDAAMARDWLVRTVLLGMGANVIVGGEPWPAWAVVTREDEKEWQAFRPAYLNGPKYPAPAPARSGWREWPARLRDWFTAAPVRVAAVACWLGGYYVVANGEGMAAGVYGVLLVFAGLGLLIVAD